MHFTERDCVVVDLVVVVAVFAAVVFVVVVYAMFCTSQMNGSRVSSSWETNLSKETSHTKDLKYQSFIFKEIQIQ